MNGFTLLETLFSGILFSLVLWGFTMTMEKGIEQQTQTQTAALLAQRIDEWSLFVLRSSDSSTRLSPGSHSTTFQDDFLGKLQLQWEVTRKTTITLVKFKLVDLSGRSLAEWKSAIP